MKTEKNGKKCRRCRGTGYMPVEFGIKPKYCKDCNKGGCKTLALEQDKAAELRAKADNAKSDAIKRKEAEKAKIAVILAAKSKQADLESLLAVKAKSDLAKASANADYTGHVMPPQEQHKRVFKIMNGQKVVENPEDIPAAKPKAPRVKPIPKDKPLVDEPTP